MPYDRILDLMSPAGDPDIYLLGNFAKRLTLYSQQIRAINLVNAVHWYRKPWRNARLAVVGGGVAGITAAAQAFRLGARVTLIERLQDVLELQYKSDRWLHPTLYEWPFFGLDTEETDLPLMNWKAGTAGEVAQSLRQQWTSHFASDVQKEFNSKLLQFSRCPEGCRLRWLKKTRSIDEEGGGCFDAVIFAVGFGLEPKGPNRRSYWENDALDKTLHADECVLIAGYGDGALTDLMRACLNKFDHRELLTSVVRGAEGTAVQQIKGIESDDRASDASYITAAYKEVDAPKVRAILEPQLNATRKVVLAGQGPYLFDPRANALNRLIASQLLRLDAFEHIPLRAEERFGAADANDPVFVQVQQSAGRPFTDIVLRIGVERTISQIEGLPPSVTFLQRQWDGIPAKSDPTRVRLWARFQPKAEDIDRTCVLFLAPDSDKKFLEQVAARAIKDVESPEVLHLNVVSLTECFRSDEAFLHSVRELCRAPMAIFALGNNMGRENPAGMLLMGIRAAARRGATLIVHEGVPIPADWAKLPFNLKELHVYPLDAKSELRSAALITGAIREGLGVLRSDSQGYRDMPVFDIVRRPTRRTEILPSGEREVFVLCSYDESYDESWRRLELWLRGKKDEMGSKLSLKRVIDYESPLLAGERLYELTRHAGTCLIDWTNWSPNVFFEMGVRLAVASTAPLYLLRNEGESVNSTAQQLIDRFDPLRYQLGESGEAFHERFLARLRAAPVEGPSVYSTVERNLSLQDEYGGRALHEQLFASVQAMLGPDLANLNVLYGRNLRLRRQILQSAATSLRAAELLVEESGRETLAELKGQIESLLSEVRELLDNS